MQGQLAVCIHDLTLGYSEVSSNWRELLSQIISHSVYYHAAWAVSTGVLEGWCTRPERRMYILQSGLL